MPRNKQKKNTKKLARDFKDCKISAPLIQVSKNTEQSENISNDTKLDHNQNEKTSLTQIKYSKVPPIFIHKPVDFKLHAHTLILSGVTFYQPHQGKIYTKINCVSFEDYISMVQYLKKHKLPYHTYGDPAQKKMKVVIRGLPINTSLNVLKDELKSLNIPIVRVHKMDTLQSKKQHPLLVLAVVANNEDGKKLLQMEELLGHKVKLEPPITKAKQCHRCQKWGHSQRYCRGVVRCVKCAGEHASSKCTRDPKRVPPKCANCGGDHTASYRKCPYCPESEEYKTIQNKKKYKMQPCIKPAVVTLLNYQDLYKNIPPVAKFEEVF